MAAPTGVLETRQVLARRVVLSIALSILGVCAIDSLLFRTPLYLSLLEPDSSTGIFEMTLFRERQAQAANGDNMVVTLGDSRFAYAPRLANVLTPQTGLVFRHAGVAGSDARSWYYMLRDLDPTARRYRAVILGVDDYSDNDEAFNPNDDIRALHYCIARLRWSDVPGFALSFESAAVKWQALRGSILKGLVLQQDIYEFLAGPKRRIDYVRLTKSGYEGWTYNYEEVTQSMAGLTIDWKTRTAAFPPGADQNQHETVQNALLREPWPQTGKFARFRREWFGRILDRYRGSRTKVIFVRLPRGAIPRPDDLDHKISATIREFGSRPNVMLAPEHAFDDLEHPELFRDGIHLNRAGIARFSPMLAQEIARMLNR